MRLIPIAVLVSCLAQPLSAQTPQPVTSTEREASRPAPISSATPRKERLSLIEALIQRDRRIAAAIRKLELNPEKSK